MTRADFYGKSIIVVITAAIWTYFSADKESMRVNLTWATSSLAAYLLWKEWTFLPKSWTNFISEKVKP